MIATIAMISASSAAQQPSSAAAQPLSRSAAQPAGPARPARQGSAGPRPAAGGWLLEQRELAVAADEVVGRRLEAVDHAAHVRHGRPGQHLLDAADGEIPDHLRLAVVLAAEDALAARVD